MFIFAEGKSQEGEEEEEGTNTPPNNMAYIQRNNDLKRGNTRNSMDEFVLL